MKDDSIITPQSFVDDKERRRCYGFDSIPSEWGVTFNPCFEKMLPENRFVRDLTGFSQPRRVAGLDNGLGVAYLGVGAPMTVMGLEELICLGGQAFISVGAAGSVRDEVRAGDFVIPDKALVGEGTSEHYGHHDFGRPDQHLVEALEECLEVSGEDYHKGPCFSTDAFYRETPRLVNELNEKGVLAVDMEASAVFNVSHYRGCRAASLFYVSDRVSSGVWEPEFHKHKVCTAKKKVLGLALSALELV